MDLVSLRDTDHHETHTVSTILVRRNSFKVLIAGCKIQNTALHLFWNVNSMHAVIKLYQSYLFMLTTGAVQLQVFKALRTDIANVTQC